MARAIALNARIQDTADGSRDQNFPQIGRRGRFGWRGLFAAALAFAVGWGGIVYAANNSVQGPPRRTRAVSNGDAPTAILIEAVSGSVLFEKKRRRTAGAVQHDEADDGGSCVQRHQRRATSNSPDEYRISENAWRKGGRAGGRLDDVAILTGKCR